MSTKNEKLDRLIKIADFLDKHDREEDADFVEDLIRDEVGVPREVEVEVPEEELAQIREVYELMGESLAKPQ